MIDLSNATFIIPLRIESEDRLRNIITVLCFLLGNFDTKIIVKEVDKSSVFIEEVIPQIHEFLGKDSHITHIFEKSDDPVFYRMHILNEMNKECDVIYPFGSGNYQKQIHATDELVSDFLNNDFDFSILDRKSNIWSSDFGWVQFFNRQVYIDGGMENENFKGSSPEDKERFYRFTTLGYNVGRINNLIYHLEHSRGSNSWPTSMHGNPYMRNNLELWETIQKMNREQLLEYYSTQSYLKKYVSI